MWYVSWTAVEAVNAYFLLGRIFVRWQGHALVVVDNRRCPFIRLKLYPIDRIRSVGRYRHRHQQCNYININKLCHWSLPIIRWSCCDSRSQTREVTGSNPAGVHGERWFSTLRSTISTNSPHDCRIFGLHVQCILFGSYLYLNNMTSLAVQSLQ